MDKTIQRVKTIVELFINLHLECDGLTRVIHHILVKNDVSHTCYSGTVVFNTKRFPVHYWIKFKKYVIDYRLRMWFGKLAPHGIFKPAKNNVEYNGREIDLTISDSTFDILIGNYGQRENPEQTVLIDER